MMHKKNSVFFSVGQEKEPNDRWMPDSLRPPSKFETENEVFVSRFGYWPWSKWRLSKGIFTFKATCLWQQNGFNLARFVRSRLRRIAQMFSNSRLLPLLKNFNWRTKEAAKLAKLQIISLNCAWNWVLLFFKFERSALIVLNYQNFESFYYSNSQTRTSRIVVYCLIVWTQTVEL